MKNLCNIVWFSLGNLFYHPPALHSLFTNANKHHQIAQSKIEFCNYLNYLFARVHYQIVIMPNTFFWVGKVAAIMMGVIQSISGNNTRYIHFSNTTNFCEFFSSIRNFMCFSTCVARFHKHALFAI